MMRVLAAPVAYRIHDRRYAKAYNLLSNFTDDDVRVDAYVNQTLLDLSANGALPTAPNVYIHDLDAASKPGYLVSAFRTADRAVRRGDVDVYMHMNLDYRWFNPLAVTNRIGDTSFVIGPSQAGHSVNAEEFERLANRNPWVDVPPALARAGFRAVDPLLRAVLNPARLELFERTLEQADQVVVVHEEAKRVYEQFVDSSNISVIPLGVSPTEFEYAERQDTHDVVAVGALRERKGYDVLLDAFESACETVPAATLHIFGDGPLKSELKRQTERLGIRDSVRFHGFVDQAVVREHMQRARLFVHPSRSESFSLVRLEAMSTGCPMVVTDISGAREMISDGEEGFVVPVEDADALAESMTRILTDFDLACELGRNARETVERRYDWQEIGRQYVELMRTVT